jgi:hypothetical protein
LSEKGPFTGILQKYGTFYYGRPCEMHKKGGGALDTASALLVGFSALYSLDISHSADLLLYYEKKRKNPI